MLRIGAGKFKPQSSGAPDDVVWLQPARIREKRSRLPLFILGGVLLAAGLVVLFLSRPTGSLQQQADPARTTILQPRPQPDTRVVPPIIPPAGNADRQPSLAPPRSVAPAVPLTPPATPAPEATPLPPAQALPAPTPVQPPPAPSPAFAPPLQLTPPADPAPSRSADTPVTRAAPPPAVPSSPASRREPPAVAPPAASEAAPSQSTGGSYSAFLSAGLPDQATARAQLLDLQRKYSAALGAHRLSYKGVKSGSELTYRLRVGHLSREEAEGLCTRIKAQGGDCDPGAN